MNSQELVRLFRLDVADETEPTLWSDRELYSFANDAQKEYARQTGGIPDASTPEVTLLRAAVDAKFVPTHESIMKIRNAFKVLTGVPVPVVNFEDMVTLGLRFDGGKGPVGRIIVGMQDFAARWLPIPNVEEDIQLIVDRYPLCDITVDKAPQKLEIPPQHHEGLMLWMKKRAYEKQDAETFDKVKSNEFEVKFRTFCFGARQEKDRRKHKTRVVAYGGLPMGGGAHDDYGRPK